MPRLHLRCSCGAVSWDLIEGSPRTGIRYICHCDDCQAFAFYTGHQADMLDTQGGLDAYQLPSTQIEFHSGLNRLACVQVTSRPLLRWHCGTCRTPVAGTYHSAKLSFVSVSLCAAAMADREAVCGPSSGHVWTKFGWGDLSKVKQCSIPAMLWRMASRMVRARLSGDYRNNPFFHADGRPLATPHVLSRQERDELDAAAKLAAGKSGALTSPG